MIGFVSDDLEVGVEGAIAITEIQPGLSWVFVGHVLVANDQIVITIEIKVEGSAGTGSSEAFHGEPARTFIGIGGV